MGISPHFTNEIWLTRSFGCWRITGTRWVGAMLYRWSQSSSHGAVSKYSSMICFRLESRYLPHIGRLWQIGQRDDYGGMVRGLFLPARCLIDFAAFESICEGRRQ